MKLSKKQEAELIVSLQGRGEIPLKFAYLGKGADNWNAIESTRLVGGGINSLEANLLHHRIDDFLKSFGDQRKLNIIDLGCGGGTAVYPILQRLKQLGYEYIYVAVDISDGLLNKACEYVSTQFGCPVKKILLDFESGNLSDIALELKQGGYSNLFCFLGSTIGNFSNSDRILTNFRDSMGSNDYLLLGVELTNIVKSNKILSHYDNELVRNFIYYIPEEIGFLREKLEFLCTRNDVLKQVEIRMGILCDMDIKIGDSIIHFEKSETILLSKSAKYNENIIQKLLSETGFRTELLTTSMNRGYLLSMVQPTRYTS